MNDEQQNLPDITDDEKEKFKNDHGFYDLQHADITHELDEDGNILMSSINDPYIQELMRYMPKHMRNNLKISPERLKELSISIATIQDGYLATLPKICNSDQCVYQRSCPFLKMSIDHGDNSFLPIGQMCPFELMVINKAISEYMRDLDLKWENRVDRIYIMELIEYDIFDLRTNADIANNRYIMENVIGVTEDKEPIIHLEKSIAIDIKMGFKRNRERILDALMATRKSRHERMNYYDPAQYSADLVEQYQNKKKNDFIAKKKAQERLESIKSVDLNLEDEDEQ